MLKKVALPGGEIVEIPSVIEDTWFENRQTGHVDPALLAPHVKQPRLHMDPVKLAELKASVASQGVRESVVVTPMKHAPWAVVNQGNETLPFLIVSGHRRREAALSGKVLAVPIEVRLYESEAAFNEDAETLNDHRQDLSEIEEGWRYRRKLEAGDKITHMSDRTGHAVQWIQARIHLTYLSPRIQERVSATLKPRDRMAIGFAAALGSVGLGRVFSFDEEFDFQAKLEELGDKKPLSSDASDDEKRFRVQHAYLAYCTRKGWKGTVSEKFVRTGEAPSAGKVGHAHGGGRGPHMSEAPKQAKGLRMQMVDWIRHLNDIGFLDMTAADLDKAFSNAVAQDLDAVADRIVMVADVLRTVAKKKPRYSEEALGKTKRPEQTVLEDC